MNNKLPIFFGLAVLLIAADAAAFCGFYVGGAGKELFNDASMVVMMRDGTRTVVNMQNDYAGPPENFAMVVPVPQVLKEENVKTLPTEIFARVDALASPRLVEYWEQDPCRVEYPKGGMVMRSTSSADFGAAPPESVEEFGVKVEAEFKVAEYDIVILSAKEATGLEKWLTANKYNIPKNSEKMFRPYIESGMYFFVAKVDVKKVKFEPGGRAQLSPLRFFYDSGDFFLPIRLGLINSRGSQDLIVHILGKNQRYEVGNYKNVFIPTNLELKPKTKKSFGPFYATLFDRVTEENPGAVVTEYAWQATKCDPCPGGAAGGGGLRPEDIATLGADVIKPRDTERIGGQTWSASPWVLTRLHARYSAKTAGEDLVFRKANPIVGGRESEKSRTAKPSSLNQFQGRYIIRHRWRGPVKCKSPRYGNWGGPPNGGRGVSAAPKSAYVKKRNLKLPSYVRGKLPAFKKSKARKPKR